MSNQLFDGTDRPTDTVADSSGSPVPDPDDFLPTRSNRKLIIPVLVGLGVFFTYPLRLGIESVTGLPIATHTALGLWCATIALPALTYIGLELYEALR